MTDHSQKKAHHSQKKTPTPAPFKGRATTVLRVILVTFLVLAVVVMIVHEVRDRAALASNNESDPAMAAGTPSSAVPATGLATDDTSVPKNGVIAYDFRNTQRCQSCITIENWTSDALKAEFAPQLADGTLIWRPLDVQQPANAHFIQDYQLTSISVVLVRYTNGKPGKWENLQNVWQLLGDQKAFEDYITSSTRSFLDSKE
ncbi:MAG: nitrophenyl compound nitroreductase subunit ArsF family protein [Caldiserica bacterium]|nr:nitrophenyl compound nitroreductase subunit ArsF family protein [Caldisericota bacterium]